MMPGFFRDMPKPQGGMWTAVVLRSYYFGGRKEVWSKKVKGLRRAYIIARIMALWEDIWCPHYDGEVGIDWAVRQENKNNP